MMRGSWSWRNQARRIFGRMNRRGNITSQSFQKSSATKLLAATAITGTVFLTAAATDAITTPASTCQNSNGWQTWPTALATTTSCSIPEDPNHVFQFHGTEPERYHRCLDYHQCVWKDYMTRWTFIKASNSSTWPKGIPSGDEIESLEIDLRFCKRSPNYRRDETYCDNLQFKIASYLLLHSNDQEDQKQGLQLVKDLAERGHADGMCLYGIVLNEGRVAGVDANPRLAVVWWRRCVSYYQHMPSLYELAVALYTGEGVAENVELAIEYFRKAADLGHVGATYMLAECYLDGVGVQRDRADALEWLVAAAELGHQRAQRRVMAVLLDDPDIPNIPEDDFFRWLDDRPGNPVSIERRFTIGGGSGNPVVLARRITAVEESRHEDDDVFASESMP